MNKYDCAKRIKELFDHECSLRRKENVATKTIHEYHKKLKILKSRIEKQRRELKRLIASVEKLNNKNTKLRTTLNDKLLVRLQQQKQSHVQLREENGIKLQQQIEVGQRAFQEMNNLHCFQSQTKTFFNVRRLPKLIQGLTICEQENTCQLIPFKIDPQQHTHEEVMDILWEKLRKSGSYKEHWQYLIFGDCVMDNETHSKTDTKVEAEAK